MQGELTGAERVLDLADRMRRCGGGAPHRLHYECVAAFRRGEIPFDQVTPLFRHAAVHAGSTRPVGGWFVVCPVCHAPLDRPKHG